MQIPGTCSYCGQPGDPQARFCTNCGASLSPPAALASAQGNRATGWGDPSAVQPVQPMPDSALQLASVLPGQQSLKQAGLILLFIAGGTLAALVALGLLAWFIPGLRGLFFCFVGLIVVTLFLIYLFVRHLIHEVFRRLLW